jgi:hypothetical protein
VATTGAAKAKQVTLPRSATITVRNQTPKPDGRVEVAPGVGRVHFRNKDKKGYRLRFWKQDTGPHVGLDILFPPNGVVTVIIKKEDEFFYTVFDIGDEAATGKGGGPIVN